MRDVPLAKHASAAQTGTRSGIFFASTFKAFKRAACSIYLDAVIADFSVNAHLLENAQNCFVALDTLVIEIIYFHF